MKFALPKLTAALVAASMLVAAPQVMAQSKGDILVEQAQADPAARIAEWEPRLASARNQSGFPTEDDLALMDALALAYILQDQIIPADALYREIVAGWAQQGIAPQDLAEITTALAGLRQTLAENLRDQGRHEEARIMWLNLAAEGRERVANGDQDGVYPILQLANTYTALGQTTEAESLLRDILQFTASELGTANPYYVTARKRLGDLLLDQRRHEEALPELRGALAAFEDLYGADSLFAVDTRISVGMTLTALSQFAEAEPLLVGARDSRLAELGPDNLLTLRAQNDLALHYIEAGRVSDGVAMLEEVTTALETKLGRDHPEAAQSRQNLSLSLRRDGSDMPRALALAREAVADLRQKRLQRAFRTAGSGGDSSSLIENSTFYGLAEIAFNARGQVPDSDVSLISEAFVALQEATTGPATMAVANQIARSMAQREGPEVAARVAELQELEIRHREGSAARDAILTGGQTGNVAQLEEALNVLSGEIAAKRFLLARELPAFSDLVYAPPLALSDLGPLVADTDHAVLFIVPTALGTHMIAADRNGITWQRSTFTDKGLAPLVRRLLWDVGASVDVSLDEDIQWSGEGEGPYPFDRTTAHQLYNELIAPVAERLGKARHVTIAATGALSSLPFGMLVTEPPQGADGDPAALRETAWFADAHALAQVPSLQSLLYLRKHGRSSDSGVDGFQGFGDPALGGEATTRGSGGARGRAANSASRGGAAIASLYRSGGADTENNKVDANALRSLTRLPGTRVELERMRSAFDAPADSIMLGDQATEAAFKSAPLQNARVLALATHGLLAGEIDGALEPGLVFTPPGGASETGEDGLLTTSEIAGLQLAAEWVILSACNTAAGDGSAGAPALSGLASAFFSAGARSLLASHWPVRDDVSALLTVRTIEIARANPSLSRAEALQRAMREIRNDASHDTADDTWAHPNAWAPFSFIGDAAGS